MKSNLLQSKIGRWCWFKHPDTGRIIEGTYRRGRKVVQITGMTRMSEDRAGNRGFTMDETTWTVPPNVKITMGQPPRLD